MLLLLSGHFLWVLFCRLVSEDDDTRVGRLGVRERQRGFAASVSEETLSEYGVCLFYQMRSSAKEIT